jgi:opacity protein-like surface antigen
MKMKKTILATAMAAIAIPATAHANEAYVGVSGGVQFSEKSKNKGEFTADVPATPDWGAIPSGTSLAWDTKLNTGYNFAIQFGYKFDSGLRTEVEAFYGRNGVDSHANLAAGGAIIDDVDVAVLTRGAPDPANPTVGEVIADGQGSLKTMGVMLNGFYDFNVGGGFEPYVGAGVGLNGVSVTFSPSGVPVADKTKTKLAWQLMAGGTIALSEGTDLFGQVTYRGMDRAKVPLTLLPADLGVKSNQTILSLGVRFKI